MWDSKNVTDKSPRDAETSYILQPPIVAIAVWHVYKRLKLESEDCVKNFSLTAALAIDILFDDL
ncbi:MAG: hypothetical protein AAB475_00655 [Patescibacteria group bacterium]